jgi:hypothetical protein
VKKIYLFVLGVTLVFTACTGEPSPTQTEHIEPTEAEPTTSQPSPTPQNTPTRTEPTETTEPQQAESDIPAPTPTQPADFEGLSLPTDRGEFFAGSGVCSICHTGLTDESDNDVSIDSYWRSTMMANAARDPYWLAAVQGEVFSNGELKDIIEDKCTTCHMPMARYTATAGGSLGSVYGADGFLNPENELHNLAMDAVSCTLCHQIEPTGLGEPESFSGGYLIDPDLPPGERLNYGPFEINEDQAAIMQATSRYIPLLGEHIEESDLCASCHTLYTPYVNRAGEVMGEFPEQMAYFEWLNSGYKDDLSCQVCHMPLADGGVILSITGGEPREPFFQHEFVGGNILVLEMLRAFGDEINVTTSSTELDTTISHTLDQLQQRTATISLDEVQASSGQLIADVSVQTQVGHKFPTGFPSRRAWIHFTVQDAEGSVVFESGGYNPDGFIEGNDNDEDETAYEIHYQTIEDPTQVQIYETIIHDTENDLTTILLFGSGYIKDNRLLPSGFDKESANPDIAVHGEAASDTDFQGGGDTIQYLIDLGESQGPFTISAELLYQTISYRWAQNLAAYDTLESARFMDYYQAVDNLPVIIDSVSMTIGE